MQIFLLTFIAFTLAMAGIGAGLFLGRGAPRGSCGGLNLADGTRIECGACPRHERCRKDKRNHKQTGQAPAGVES